MQITVIVNMPMTMIPQRKKYVSDDKSIAASDREVGYPVLSFLEETINTDDSLKFLLLTKHSEFSKWEQRVEEFKSEADQINRKIEAEITFEILDSDFEETKYVHEKLMEKIVSHIDNGSHIIADITYGPKDLPIVVFSALMFAEKFLGCQIDNIIYGQGVFNDEGEIINTKICDMSPLYALNSLTGTMQCDDPQKARKMLNAIVSL